MAEKTDYSKPAKIENNNLINTLCRLSFMSTKRVISVEESEILWSETIHNQQT